MTESTSAGAAPPGISVARRRLVLSALLLATVLASLDSSFVPIAFPDIIDKLDTSTSVVVWVALGYLISATGLMLLSSRLSAFIGSDRVFQLGVFIYSCAMIACTWAPDIETLIALRVIQGAGMALFLPITFSLAAELYSPAERTKALGIMQAGNSVGFVLGPIFAGWLLDAYDWRALFGTRIPLALLAIAGSFLITDVKHRAKGAVKQEWDLLGAFLLTLAIFGMLFGLNRLPVEDNHRDLLVWAIMAGGFAALYLFVRHEGKAKLPLIDLSLFRESREFTRACLAFTAYFAALPVQLFVLPLVLISAMEFSAWDTGMTLAVIAVSTTIISPAAGKLAGRFGAARLAVAGAVLTVAGYLALLPIEATHGQLALMPAMLLLGVGSALFFAPNNALMMGNVPPRALVTAAGLIGVLRQSGYAAGFAMIASLVTAIQDNIEEIWTAASALHLQPETAANLAHLFEGGGIWSPEILLFAMRVGVLIAVAILAISILTSWPKLALGRRLASLTAGGLVAGVAAGVLGIAAVSGIPLSFGGAVTTPVAVNVPAAFGYTARSVADESTTTPVSADGAALYALHCVACHGADRRGVAELGVTLVGSPYITRIDSAELVAFLKVGRMPGQPGNVSGRVMPGFSYLPETELQALVDFLRRP
jgi:DHA2 family methylenomycin A resistance protein-like MFS transporter